MIFFLYFIFPELENIQLKLYYNMNMQQKLQNLPKSPTPIPEKPSNLILTSTSTLSSSINPSFFQSDQNYQYFQLQIESLLAMRTQSQQQPVNVYKKNGIEVEIVNSIMRFKLQSMGCYQEVGCLKQQNQQLKINIVQLQLRLAKVEQLQQSQINIEECQPPMKQFKIQQKQQFSTQVDRLNSIINSLTIQNNNLTIQLQQLKYSLQLPKQVIVLKQIPVYIQKEILVEVAVPIYINQNRQQKIYQHLTINNSIFPEENSIAINELNSDLDPSDACSDTRRSNFKFKNKSKSRSKCSFHFSDVVEDVKSMSIRPDTRERRVKEIVEVPVYIEKEVLVYKEKDVVKSVGVEVGVGVGVDVEEERNGLGGWLQQSVFPDFEHIQEESMESRESGQEGDGPARSDFSIPLQKKSMKQIIIEVPVEIEKEVIIIKEVFIPIQIPIEIFVEREIFIDREVKVQIIIDKLVPPHESQVKEVVSINCGLVSKQKHIQHDYLVVNPLIQIIQIPIEILLDEPIISNCDKYTQLNEEYDHNKIDRVECTIYMESKAVQTESELASFYLPEQKQQAKIVQIIPVEVECEILQEKTIEIIKETIIQKPIYIQLEIPEISTNQAQTQIEVSQFDLLPSNKLNICYPLTDRSQQSISQKIQIPDNIDYNHYSQYQPHNQQYQIHQNNINIYQNQLQSDSQQMKQQLKNLKLRAFQIIEQKTAYATEIEKAKEEINQLEYRIQQMKKSIQRVIAEKYQLQMNLCQEASRREIMQNQFKQMEQELKNSNQQHTYLQNIIVSMERKLKAMEDQREREQGEMFRQIEQRNKQMEEEMLSNQQVFYQSKQEIEKLTEEKYVIQCELIRVKKVLEERGNEEEQAKQQFQSRFVQLLNYAEHLKEDYELKLERMEGSYRSQLLQISCKHSETISEKDEEIERARKESMGRGERWEGKQKIIQTGRTSQGGSCRGDRDVELYEENQRFLQTMEQQNSKICELNQQIYNLNQLVCDLYHQLSSVQTRSNPNIKIQGRDKTKSFYFQYQPQPQTQTHNGFQSKGQRTSREKDIYEEDSMLKDQEIARLRELVNYYQDAISDLQGEISNFQGVQRHLHFHQDYFAMKKDEEEMRLGEVEWREGEDFGEYSRGLLQKISLLSLQVRFERREKVKANIRLRECERANCELSNKFYHDQEALLVLNEELQQERSAKAALQREGDRRGRELQGQVGEWGAIERYRLYKVQYFKLLELSGLIGEEVGALEGRVPSNCEENVSKIKRFLRIIENNHKNANTASRAVEDSRVNRSRLQDCDYADILYSELVPLAS